jgi:Kef-type K+ transport system membrane component KefB
MSPTAVTESPVDDAERRILPAPRRGLIVAVGLIATAILVGLAFCASGWFSAHSHAVHTTAPAAADPVLTLGGVAMAVGVICAIAVLVGAGFRRIGQPPVVGEILAGLILGPSLLGTLVPGAWHAVFAASVMPYVRVAAQAGLIIFMFSVGRDFDPAALRGQWSTVGGLSAATMAVSFMLGTVVAVPLLGRFGGASATTGSFAIFLGTALSVTAFPVLARILQDTGLQGTRLGTLAQSIAAVVDVLAWFALAVATAMVSAKGPGAVLRVVVPAVLLALACILVLRPLVRTLSQRYADAAVPDTVRLLIVLGIVIGLAVATDKIGIHAIFGGFLAGLVLPRDNLLLGEVTHQVTRLSRALLVPVYFVSVGLAADLRLVTQPAVIVGGVLLLVVAVAGKLIGSVPLAWAGGMPVRSAFGLGALMNARGVTEIVVLSIGLSVGVINVAAFTVLVIIAVLTSCMAAPALRLLGLAPRIAAEPAPRILAEPTPRTPAELAARAGSRSIACATASSYSGSPAYTSNAAGMPVRPLPSDRSS